MTSKIILKTFQGGFQGGLQKAVQVDVLERVLHQKHASATLEMR